MDIPMYPTLDKKTLPPYASIPEDLSSQCGQPVDRPTDQSCHGATTKPCSLLANSWDRVDPELGVTPEEERNRSEGLALMFNMNNYSRETYHQAFFAVMDLNNTIYNGIYVTVMLVLACTLGLLFSITMAIVTALIEFINLFILRPTAKILKIILDYVRIPIYLLANVFAPFLERIFPGSYKFLKVPMYATPYIPINKDH